MAFTPILNNQPISYVISNTHYRNSARETLAGGTPVFFVPTTATLNDYGFGGPKYQYGYTYYNSSSNIHGNCTWWCWGRLYEAMGTMLPNYGDAFNWYSRYSGSKETNANNIQAGDIIVFSDSAVGHVMFVEKVSGNTVYISHSAYSTRSVWSGRACMVNNYQKSELSQGNAIDMYKNVDSPYYVTVIGILHTGGSTPPTPGTTPSVTVTPASYTSTLTSTDSYIDFNFTITVTGIPEDENANSGISFSSNCYRYAYTSNWTYTTYTSGGVTYKTGVRSLIVRYDRLHDYAYTDNAYMYYIKSFSNGSVNSTTQMKITIQAASSDPDIEIISMFKRKKRRLFNLRRY